MPTVKVPSFVAYIDESGDEGWKFRTPGGAGGSSRWFVLSAAVFCVDAEPEAVKAIDRVRTILKRGPRASLHFRDLKHSQRVAFVRELARAPFRAISILVCKPELSHRAAFRVKDRLYFYAGKLLLERVSRLCRDRLGIASRPLPGDGSAQLIFSDRRSTSHVNFQAYLTKLRASDTNIHWPVIDESLVAAHPHGSRKGLYFADAIASSFFYYVEENEYGFTEPRYANELQPVVYHGPDERYLGYGVKGYPSESLGKLSAIYK